MVNIKGTAWLDDGTAMGKLIRTFPVDGKRVTLTFNSELVDGQHQVTVEAPDFALLNRMHQIFSGNFPVSTQEELSGRKTFRVSFLPSPDIPLDYAAHLITQGLQPKKRSASELAMTQSSNPIAQRILEGTYVALETGYGPDDKRTDNATPFQDTMRALRKFLEKDETIQQLLLPRDGKAPEKTKAEVVAEMKEAIVDLVDSCYHQGKPLTTIDSMQRRPFVDTYIGRELTKAVDDIRSPAWVQAH